MGNFLSALEDHDLYSQYDNEYPEVHPPYEYGHIPTGRRHLNIDRPPNIEFSEYTNITATVFVIVMIILLMVLLVCCCKTILVCRKQKRVNDQRRRMMQRDQQNSNEHTQQPVLRAYTIDNHQHTVELPGGGFPVNVMYQPEYIDSPPAYDQVMGLPPSYDSVVLLNGRSISGHQSRVGSIVGSIMSSGIMCPMGGQNSDDRTIRSIRSRIQNQPAESVISSSTLPPSEIGSTKSESIIASVSSGLILHHTIITADGSTTEGAATIQSNSSKRRSRKNRKASTASSIRPDGSRNTETSQNDS